MCQSSFSIPVNGQISISMSFHAIGASIDKMTMHGNDGVISSFRLVKDSSDNGVYIEFYYNTNRINSVDIVFISPYIFSYEETISVISNVEETTSTSIEIATLTL